MTGVSSTEPLVRDRGVASVRRIGPVLDLFTADRPEWRMSEIARALSMPKSTTHALLGSMVEVGLLSLTPRRRYQLGWSLLSLGERMRVGLDFRRHALPAMQELARAVHETVVLCALDRSSVVVVERVEGDHRGVLGRLEERCVHPPLPVSVGTRRTPSASGAWSAS